MLNVLIVDDEAPARERLTRLLIPLLAAGRVRIADQAADGEEALERITEGGIDLALLDVQMPGLDGLTLLDRIPPDRRPAIVFTTAYDQYALKAFEVAAVDYLLKPIEAERLEAAIARVEAQQARGSDGQKAGEDRLAELLEYLDRQVPSVAASAVSAPTTTSTSGEAPQEPLRQLTVQHRDRLLVLSVDALLSAEVQDGITRLYMLADDGGKPRVERHLVSYPLETLEARLDPQAFVRVHRAALVQTRHIREMIPWFSGRYKLVLTGGHEVVASRTRSRELRDRLSL